MAQTSYPWGGTAVGDATLAPYDDDEWSDIWRKLFCSDRTVQGVVRGYLNELNVVNPAGTTARVWPGAALVDGKFYENTVSVDNALTAPGAGSNFYTIVLRKDFVAQTVRIAVLGPSAVAPPTVTQTDGVTWEISLATVEVDSGSNVTITDTRNFIQMPQVSQEDNIADLAVSESKIAVASRHTRLFQTTLGAPGQFDFNNIPQGYKNLRIIGQLRSVDTAVSYDDVDMVFNGSGAAQYAYGYSDFDYLIDSGFHNHLAPSTFIMIGAAAPDDASAGIFALFDCLISNYSSSTIFKNVQARSTSQNIGGGTGFIGWMQAQGYWGNVNPITRIQLYTGGGPNFAAGSHLTVYGLP